jgi:tripartite-type tricarboxylate transporter receptor subunit TctC
MIGGWALPRLVWAFALTLAAHACADADATADFYRGKTISLYVGFPPGGGYDLYARVLAPYFSRHIPGTPPIVIKSMLGGSGMKAAGYMSTVTPQDGTSLGVFIDALTLGKVLGGPGEFDPVRLVWIGRIVSTATVSVVWHTSPVQTIEEAKHRELLMAGTVASNTSSFIPAALNDLIGTKIRVILGFRGSPDQALAMMRGEALSICRTIQASSISRSTSARARFWASWAAAPISAARSWPSPVSRPSAPPRCAAPSWRPCKTRNSWPRSASGISRSSR